MRQIEEAISRARLNGSSTNQDSSSGSSSSDEEDRELSLVLSDIESRSALDVPLRVYLLQYLNAYRSFV